LMNLSISYSLFPSHDPLEKLDVGEGLSH